MFLLLVSLLPGLPARAQALPDADAADARQRALRQVTSACRAEYPRFCRAAQARPNPEPRNEVICLKTYRASLSLRCRHAIDQARR